MKKLLFLIFSGCFLQSCAKTSDKVDTVSIISNEKLLDSLRNHVKYIFRKDSLKINKYLKDTNGILYDEKSSMSLDDDIQVQTEYLVLKEKGIVYYVRKEPISESGDWVQYDENYFDKKGKLIGFDRFLRTFGDNNLIIECNSYNVLNNEYKFDKKIVYKDNDGNLIPAQKAKESMIVDIDVFDEIKYNNIEEFIKIENISFSDTKSKSTKLKFQDKKLIKYSSPDYSKVKDSKSLSEFVKFYEDRYGRSFFSGIPNFYFYYEIQVGSLGVGISIPIMLDTRDGNVYDVPEVWATCENYGNKINNADEFTLNNSFYQIESCDEESSKSFLYSYNWDEDKKTFVLITKK